MTVRIDSPAEQRTRSRAIAEAHRVWVADELAAGTDGPVPPGRPSESDYNEHVPDLEASGMALDRFAREVAAMGGAP